MLPELQEDILKILKMLVLSVDQDCQIELDKEGDQWRINLSTLQSEEFLNKDGELIRAVQHILRVLIHRKYPEDRTHFLIDINGHRKRRENLISQKIPNIAETEVLQQGSTVILVGLTGYERLQVHRILADIKGLNTSSVGPEENRKLLIMPTSETGSAGMDKAKIYHVNQLEN